MNNSTDFIEPILEKAQESIMTRGVRGIYWLVTTAVTYFAGFVALSVTMVYFKQEGMLYHPSVPSEKYRYPKNMP